MNVGFIFECGPNGADKKVCEHLVREFFPDVTIVASRTMSNKMDLVMDCGKVAKSLVESGCELVVVLWDEQPRWGQLEKEVPCEVDVANIRRSLRSNSLDDGRVRLVCIRQELETWLLADTDAISTFLSRKKPFKCSAVKRPEAVTNPKQRLSKIFSEAKFSQQYRDLDHAEGVARSIRSLDRLRKVQSLRRFEELLLGSAEDCKRHETLQTES